MRMIQVYSLDRVLEFLERQEPGSLGAVAGTRSVQRRSTDRDAQLTGGPGPARLGGRL